MIDELLIRLLKPTPETTPDEWGANNREYPPTSGRPGKRDPWLTPYAIPFARAVASREYRRAVYCTSSQSAKTETILDIIGQRLDQRPVPILYIGPNRQFLQEQFEPRLMALLDEAPTLAGKVLRGKRMTKTRKVIAGVPLRLAHAGSSTALKSDPAGLAITDEADELMANVKGQGDPIRLVDVRGDTYEDFVHAIVSTPSKGMKETERDPVSGLEFWKVQDTDDIDSAIWSLWQQGTRYHWTWRCPHCGERFVPRFSCLRWKDQDKGTATPAQARESAVVICPSGNGCIIEDAQKEALNATGLYVAPGQSVSKDDVITGAPPPSSTASFWASGLCSPFRTFGDRAATYVEAVLSGDPNEIQAAMNAGFGELWAQISGDAPEWKEVADRRMPYKQREVPRGVLRITIGVDVQKRKLVFVVRGWGVRQESWLIDHGELHGDTRLDEVWTDLWEQVIDVEYDGLPVDRVFVDSGFRPDDPENGDIHKVYDFCRRHPRMCWATKGHDRLKQPIMPSQIEVQSTGKKSKFGLTLIHLDSDFLKEWVHARIRWPKGQPGGWHIYDAADEDYCRQLVNEARTRKPGGGYVWVPRGKAHDYLDAEALAYAAARMIGVERLNEKATPRRRRPDDGNSGGTPPASGGGNDAWSFKPVARIDNPYL